MGSEIAEAYVTIRADEAKFHSDLDHLHSGMSGKLAGIMALGTAAGEMIAKGFETALEKVKEFIGLSFEMENKQARLGAILKVTGNMAGYSAEEINKMAEALSQTSTQSKGEFLDAFTTLSRFTDIRGGNFQDAMLAARGMAAAMGEDLQSATNKMGMALESMRTGSTMMAERMLRKAGSPLSAQEKTDLENTLSGGDLAGAQEKVLQKMLKFGPVADALANTVSGKWARIKNQLEEIGISLMGHLMPAFQFIVDKLKWMVDNWETGVELLKKGWSFGWAYVKQVAFTALDDLLEGVRKIFGAIEGIIRNAIGGIVTLLQKSVSGWGMIFRDMGQREMAQNIDKIADKLHELSFDIRKGETVIPPALRKLFDIKDMADFIKKAADVKAAWDKFVAGKKEEENKGGGIGGVARKSSAVADFQGNNTERSFMGLEEFGKFLATAQHPVGDPVLEEAKKANDEAKQRKRLLELIHRSLAGHSSETGQEQATYA